MTNTPMPSSNRVEVRLGVVRHTDIAVINFLFRGGARYFVTFTDEASGHERALYVKLNRETANLMMRKAR